MTVFKPSATIDTTNFDAQKDMPETQAKLNAIAERLPFEYKFLKDTFILNKLAINHTVSELYDEYCLFCASNDRKALTKIKFTEKLREINLNHSKSNGQRKYKVDHVKLLAIAKKGHWIHELDEYDDDAKREHLNLGQKNDFSEYMFIDDDQVKEYQVRKSQEVKAASNSEDDDKSFIKSNK